MLLLLFAYGGYEAALNPTGETRNPRRDIAFALFVALVVLTALYSALQYIVIGLLPDPASSNRPLADAASASMGPFGAALVSVGAIVSICGYACANFLTAPRGMFALAERGDFPQPFAAVHPRFHTPYIAIVVFALLVWLFAQFADFSWNVTLSAVTRILYYGAVCAAVPVLRRIWPCVPALRLPGGLFLPVLGVLICTVLLTCVDFSKSSILLATVGIGLVHWALVRD
jgi:amino acid transporter